MKKIIYLPLLACLSLLFACEKEVTDVALPSATTKLVISSFISPQDTLIWVKVGQTTPAFGVPNTSNEYLNSLTVSLSDGSNEVLLSRRSQSDTFAVYREQFPIVAGQTYFLEVTAADGRQAEASCTVPQPYPSVPEILIDAETQPESQFQSNYARMVWEDIPGETNYYRVAGELKRMNTFYNPNLQREETRVDWNTVYWDGQETGVYISDAQLDGGRLDSPKGFVGSYDTQHTPQPGSSATLYAYLLHTDRNYYEYHRSVYRSLYAGDNPFAEPALVYSNVSGGVGVFAAYNRIVVEKEL